MNVAIDVHYENTSATVAGILFDDWNSDEIYKTVITTVNNVKPYEPGSFYKRELPCILALLENIPEELTCIVIDGFVTLGEDKADGLGMHLYRSLNESIPIIGVAKKPFVGTPEECEVYRGKSEKPLLLTSVGMTLERSKELIQQMHGKHRLPTLLKKADQVCRNVNG